MTLICFGLHILFNIPKSKLLNNQSTLFTSIRLHLKYAKSNPNFRPRVVNYAQNDPSEIRIKMDSSDDMMLSDHINNHELKHDLIVNSIEVSRMMVSEEVVLPNATVTSNNSNTNNTSGIISYN